MNKSMECVAYLFAPEGLEKLDFGIVTMVNFAFAIPTDQGHVLPLEKPALARAVVEKAHAAGARAVLSLGGWSWQEKVLEPTFLAATDTPEKRQQLANEIVAIAEAFDFDGVDIDWEYPRTSDGSKQQYEDFLPGYYMNKLHWNSVRAGGAVPGELLRTLLEKSYRLVLGSFSKKKQQELLAQGG